MHILIDNISNSIYSHSFIHRCMVERLGFYGS